MTGEDGKPFTDVQLRDFVLNFVCVDSCFVVEHRVT